jgi:hypothetical protein
MEMVATKALRTGNWVVDTDDRACVVTGVCQSVILYGDRAGEVIPGYFDVSVWYPDTEETCCHVDGDNMMWPVLADHELDAYGVNLSSEQTELVTKYRAAS